MLKAHVSGASLPGVDLGMLAIADTLRTRAAFYRARGYSLVAAELEHEAAIAEVLAAPAVIVPAPLPIAS